MNNMPTISADRLWNDLMELAKIGAEQGQGISRQALSCADEEAKQWFFQKCQQAGLEVRIDAVRNVIARLPSNNAQAKIIATGSHLDTVPHGGPFDGALGVVAGLESLRTIKESGLDLPHHLEVIAFCDEEGAYGAGCIGSRSMFGLLKDGELSRQTHGSSFAEDLAKRGGDANEDVQRNAHDFICFLELHIEQGSRLEKEGIDCGVVSGIVNIQRHEVIAKGKAGHAGTTPMQDRNDALILAAPLFTDIPQWTMEQNPHMVSNIGAVTVSPGVANVIPDQCKFIVELRSEHDADINAITAKLQEYIKDNAAFSMSLIYQKHGIAMHSMVQDAITKAADLAQCSHINMPSGAGHDAHTLAFKMPVGMIFIPCKEGLSHHPDEWIEKEQAANGTQILTNAINIIMAQNS